MGTAIMASLDAKVGNLNLSDHLERAIKAFEIKQVWSNQQWLTAKAEEDEVASTDEKRSEIRKLLARGFGFDSWSVLAAAHNISTPRDILQLSVDIGQKCRGTGPPVSQVERESFLGKLHTAVNEVFDHDTPNFWLVPLPDDYKTLLGITDGIHDNDLRGDGVCGIDGIRKADISKMARDHPDDLPLGGYLWRLGWNVGTGFLLGRGSPPGLFYLVYFYCAKSEKVESSQGQQDFHGQIEPGEREWKWRLFYMEKERYQLMFDKPMAFEGIVEWLEWYQEWWDRESRVYVEWAAKHRKYHDLYGADDNPDQLGEMGP